MGISRSVELPLRFWIADYERSEPIEGEVRARVWVWAMLASFSVALFSVMFAAGSFLAFKVFAHVQTRVHILIDPWSVASGAGYQTVQALYRIVPSIDVRGLLPPGPLVAILELVESIRDASPVIESVERIRAAGAGIGAFFTPTGYGTLLAKDKETRRIDGRDYVLEYPIRADFALISALRGDRWGNLVYRKTARNFGPIMASAAIATPLTAAMSLVPSAEVACPILYTRSGESPGLAAVHAVP